MKIIDGGVTAAKGFKAVSYTHLDVYKRQVIYWSIRVFMNMVPCTLARTLTKMQITTITIWIL